MDESDLPDSVESRSGQLLAIPRKGGHLVGLHGRLALPFWGWVAGWTVLCGAVASNQLRWGSEELQALALVLVLVELGWGSLWDLAIGTEWFRPLAEGWPPAQTTPLPRLPYTQPGSPGWRLWRSLGRATSWWREAFWPTGGPALLALVAAAILTAVLSLFLPGRLRPLTAAFVALTGLGLAQHRGRPLLWAAIARVGLSWLAGHAALGEVEVPSLILALAFALAVWGMLRTVEGHRGGLWLLNGGQAAGVILLVALRQPLAAGLVGLLLFGQVAVQPLLRGEGDPDRAALSRRMWPWLLAAMLAAALALP